MEISQKIIDYAIWYYLRYYPSTQKLRNKLDEKFGPNSEKGKRYWWIDSQVIDYIISEKLRNIILESEVCRSKIKWLVNKSKNKNYIVNNLLQKLFNKDMILDILENEFDSEETSLLEYEKMKRKIALLEQKGKSKNYVRQKFIERSLDKQIIEDILWEIYWDNEYNAIKSEIEKLSHRYDESKIIQKLLQKWFSYGDIKSCLIK